MVNPAETQQTIHLSYEEQVENARKALAAKKIKKVVAHGPEASPDSQLASLLGVEVDLRDDYQQVLDASKQAGVASVLPILKRNGEKIAQEDGRTTNIDAWGKLGAASIAHVVHQFEGEPVHTKLITTTV